MKDIYNGYSFYKKHPCKTKSSIQNQFTASQMNAVSKEPRAHNETNFMSKNDSIITPETDFLNAFDTFDEPLDERNIELNYELYAAAVFLFALGKIWHQYVNRKCNYQYRRADFAYKSETLISYTYFVTFMINRSLTKV